MYTLNPIKLYKAVNSDHIHMSIIRWCLDYLFVVKNNYSVNLNEIRKVWPFEENLFSRETLSVAPEFLTIIVSECQNKEDVLYSRVLKRHFEQERIMNILGQKTDIDDISVKQKLSASLLEQEVEVFKDTKNTLSTDYVGIFPTRSYDINKEVFVVTGAFYSHLVNKHPNTDVNAKLKEAYSYFINNPASRRHHSGIKRYLECWISGDLILLSKIKKTKQQITSTQFYAEFIND